jgi:hypothetical protein
MSYTSKSYSTSRRVEGTGLANIKLKYLNSLEQDFKKQEYRESYYIFKKNIARNF